MGDTKHLHQFSEKETFHQLIDCYRLRIEDDYVFSGDARGLYAGDNPGLPAVLEPCAEAQRCFTGMVVAGETEGV